MKVIKKMALALAILIPVASCTGEAPPDEFTPPDALPAAVLGTAGPLGGQSVAYYAGDAAAMGYLAIPEGAGPFPAVILIHEWNGLVDRVLHWGRSTAGRRPAVRAQLPDRNRSHCMR